MGKSNYFSDFTHPNQIYWLGFICFNSCFCKDKLKIYFKDKKHLEKLSNDLGIDFPIKKQGNKYCLTIQNIQIIKDIEKNKDLKFDENLVRHYWRGVLDSKGIVSSIKTGSKVHPIIKFKNDFETCEKFMHFCKIFTKSKAEVHKYGKEYAFSLQGESAEKIINVLYVQADAYFDKFKNKAIAIKYVNWDFI
jgi:hypothetical protein